MNFQEKMDKIEALGFEKMRMPDPCYTPQIRVMTSNALHTGDGKSRVERDKGNIFQNRLDTLAAVYLSFMPDFLGVQELSYVMMPELMARIGSVYAIPETEKGDVATYQYHGHFHQPIHFPVLYNKHKYEVLETRFHPFAVGGMLWGYHWALYRSKDNPAQRFIHMNLHFYYQADERQWPGVDETHRELVHLRRMYENVPIFVTGDYNMRRTHKHFDLLFEGLSMESAMMIAEDGEKSELHIDHISVTTDKMTPIFHRRLDLSALPLASDHAPQFADFIMNEGGEKA